MSKAVLSIGAILCASFSCSQISSKAIQAGASKVTFSEDNHQQNPLEPIGFKSPSQRDGSLPKPITTSDDDGVLIRRGQMAGGDHNIWRLQGGVDARFKGLDMSAKTAVFDLDSQVFILSGNASLVGVDQVVYADRIDINFKDRSYRAYVGDAELRPSFTQGRTLANIYVRGLESYGTESQYTIEDGKLTSCPLREPHFEFDSREIDVRPGKRIILRDTKVRLFNHTILSVPYLVFPLNDYGNRYFPEVGSDPDAGYYIKTKFTTPLNGQNELETRVDYFSKLGPAVGEQYTYYGRTAEGFLRFYTIPSRKSIDAANTHRQKIGSTILQIDNTIQKFDYLTAPDNTAIQTRMSLDIPQGNSSTKIVFNRSSNESTGFISTQQNIGLNDSRRFGTKTQTQIDINFASSSSSYTGGDTSRKQVDLRMRASQDLSKATADLEYIRSIPVGDISNFFSGSDKTPMLTVRSDSRKLFGAAFGNSWPLQSEFSIGELIDSNRQRKITRTAFDVSLSKPGSSQGRTSIDLNGRLRQTMYSDDTAQVTAGYGSSLRYSLGKDTAFNLRYSYLRPFGYSPLSLDQSGTTNVATSDLSVRPVPSLIIGAQTGYDFQEEGFKQTPWQSVGVRTEWRPAPWFQLRGLSTYDTYQRGWSNFRFDLSWRAGATSITAGARYDSTRSTLGSLNLLVDGFKMGRLKASILLNYNGYIKEFEAKHFQFTYDMHCAEAILTIIDNPIGFRSGQQIGFFIRIKALPFDTGFGVGTRGQAIGTGTGSGYGF